MVVRVVMAAALAGGLALGSVEQLDRGAQGEMQGAAPAYLCVGTFTTCPPLTGEPSDSSCTFNTTTNRCDGCWMRVSSYSGCKPLDPGPGTCTVSTNPNDPFCGRVWYDDGTYPNPPGTCLTASCRVQGNTCGAQIHSYSGTPCP
jgi:hypothetical protein